MGNLRKVFMGFVAVVVATGSTIGIPPGRSELVKQFVQSCQLLMTALITIAEWVCITLLLAAVLLLLAVVILWKSIRRRAEAGPPEIQAKLRSFDEACENLRKLRRQVYWMKRRRSRATY